VHQSIYSTSIFPNAAAAAAAAARREGENNGRRLTEQKRPMDKQTHKQTGNQDQKRAQKVIKF
jgi:7-keto-8-aminopelargonate synthetase-like enzyme